MIQPQELKLGSVLNYWIEEEKTFVPTRVDWQDLRYISEAPKGFNDSHKPIPLTEEILLKCGFVRCTGKYGVYYKHKEASLMRIWQHECYDRFTWFVGKKVYDIGTTVVVSEVCSHLHQIQNLYFTLTGKELEVKL